MIHMLRQLLVSHFVCYYTGPHLDCLQQLDELDRLSVTLPPSVEDKYNFNAMFYLKELMATYKDENKRLVTYLLSPFLVLVLTHILAGHSAM